MIAELSRRWITWRLHEFFGALRAQFGDRALPFDEKMAASSAKRFDSLLAGGQRAGAEISREIQRPIQSRPRQNSRLCGQCGRQGDLIFPCDCGYHC